MKPTHALRTYLLFGFLSALGYLVVISFFLYYHRFELLWMLPMGNVLYLLSIGLVTGYFYSRNHFQDSSISNAAAGHYASFTGAAIATLLSLALFFIFMKFVWSSGTNTKLADAPGSVPSGVGSGMLPLILIDAGFGNTVCGFFAALVVSFTAKRNQRSEVMK